MPDDSAEAIEVEAVTIPEPSPRRGGFGPMAQAETPKGKRRLARVQRAARRAHETKMRLEAKALAALERRLDAADEKDKKGRYRLSAKDLGNIANYTSRQTAAREQILRELGIEKKAPLALGPVTNVTNVLNYTGKGLTREEEELLQKLRLSQLRGETDALPAPDATP